MVGTPPPVTVLLRLRRSGTDLRVCRSVLVQNISHHLLVSGWECGGGNCDTCDTCDTIFGGGGPRIQK